MTHHHQISHLSQNVIQEKMNNNDENLKLNGIDIKAKMSTNIYLPNTNSMLNSFLGIPNKCSKNFLLKAL